VTRARRREVVDVYVEEGRAAIYSTQGMVLLLSELATTAWEALGEDWVSTTQIADELVLRFGEPSDGQANRLTEETLRSLAEMSLVEVEEEIDDAPDERPA
jgi:hypothetical protein